MAENDAFGNPIDPGAGYARGKILAGSEDEVRRMLRGRALIRERGSQLGLGSLFNLTGVTRAFPLSHEDVDKLQTQLSFYCNFDGTAEPVGIAYLGGNPDYHAACFATRVSAGLLGTMLALATSGDTVLSVIPRGHSHPSIRNASLVVGASYVEASGVSDGLRLLAELSPRFLVITTITPQKFYFDEAATVQLIAAASRRGIPVIVDDAHSALRTAFYKQRPVLELGDVTVALSSMDKHLVGPRAALIAGRREAIDQVRATLYKFGIEAPFATYVASIRAMQDGYKPDDVAAAGHLTADLLRQVGRTLELETAYSAGPGVALSEDDLMAAVLQRAGLQNAPLVPIEVSSALAMRLVEVSGLVTILAVGMPGASAALRLMMYPDGERASLERIVRAVDESLSFVADHLSDLEFMARYVVGAV
jgi:L-seryl-tRNA(Ser) seleniumtransferase